MANQSAIGYIRVSSKMQGKSGLGLEAQQRDIERFETKALTLMDTAIEVQSAKDDISSRKILTSALERCKKENCILTSVVIYTNLHYLFKLLTIKLKLNLECEMVVVKVLSPSHNYADNLELSIARREFNAIFTIHDVLTKNGYVLSPQEGDEAFPNMSRYFTNPNEEEEEGIFIVYNEIENTYNVLSLYFKDDNESIIKNSPEALKCRDAFDCFTVLECDSNKQEALKWRTYYANHLLLNDDNSETYSDGYNLAYRMPSNEKVRYFAENIARMFDCTINTAFLVCLAIFSTIFSRKYVVTIPNGKLVPIGIFLLVEQSNNFNSEELLQYLQSPIFEKIKQYINEFQANTTELESANGKKSKSIIQQHCSPLRRISNLVSTSSYDFETVRRTLIQSNGFCTLLSNDKSGGTVLDWNNKNEIISYLFAAPFVHINGSTVKNSFIGHPIGNIICFIEKNNLFRKIENNNMNFLGKFLISSESQFVLPKRHNKNRATEKMSSPSNLIGSYSSIIDELAATNTSYEKLTPIKVAKNDFEIILENKQKLNDKFANYPLLQSFIENFDIQTLKIAANLHILHDTSVSNNINSVCVKSAIGIVTDIVNATYSIFVKNGMIGFKSEIEAIISMFRDKPAGYTRTERQIIQSRSKVTPFKNSNNKTKLIRESLSEMVANGILIKNQNEFYLEKNLL